MVMIYLILMQHMKNRMHITQERLECVGGIVCTASNVIKINNSSPI